MAKEIAWGWYHELLHGHPDRVRLDANSFTDRYSAASWGSPEMVALLDEAVPDPRDRIDFAATPVAGTLVQYPASDGRVLELEPLAARVHASGALLVVAIPRTPRTSVRSWRCCRSTRRSAGHRGALTARSKGSRHPLVAGLLQRGRERSARIPGAAAAGALPRRVRAVPGPGMRDRGGPR